MKRETTDAWDLSDEELHKVDLAMDSIIRALGRKPGQARRDLQQSVGSKRYGASHFRHAIISLSRGEYIVADDEKRIFLAGTEYKARVNTCPVCGR